MKRTAFKRRSTPLRTRTPIRRRKRIRQRRATPRRRGYFEDPGYLAYLREQPCRAPATPTHWGPGHVCDAHHLRHDKRGASMGAHVKDDRRAISLCRGHHQDVELGHGPWAGWTREEIKRWENETAAQQRSAYLARQRMDDAQATG